MKKREKILNTNKGYYKLVNNYAIKLNKKAMIQKELEDTMAKLVELSTQFRNINSEIVVSKEEINTYVEKNIELLDVNEKIVDEVEETFSSRIKK